MKIEPELSPDQVRNNYEFKLIKRILMNEFPWIKDVDVDEFDLKIYSTIFINLTIDPILLANQYNWIMNPWVDNNYTTSTISMIFDISHREGEELITEPIQKEIVDVVMSNAVPQELKTPKYRRISFGSYIVR